ncbi:DUF4142 domain-containing protein [Microvirga guangxiensis]|uniref:Uncharacterized conserved protein, DUF305 family n=1 Tax=Microvirga guangxiensis TaxID=549386 RepID=A0A1G5EK32_9HYPH|nr:DUF4142 domain-containing protein [Microvirga guangxiensis]SCY27302.1 Uncharacterized conserved protein, DUF305 family [Microvirga guangxiensis]
MSSRRLMVAGIAAAFALPAFAQQSQAPSYPVTPQPTETRSNQALGQGAEQRQQRTQQGGAPQDTQTPMRQGQANSAPSAQGQQQSQADRQYVQQALALSTVSLQQSNFALSKAQDPRVKQFAEFEIGEQNTLTDVMRSFADPAATASTSAGAQASAATAPELSQEDSAAMERLSKAQPGAALDREYVTMQIQGHQKLLKLQEDYLKNSGNREMTNIAKLARGQIKEHIVLLETMQKELGR